MQRSLTGQRCGSAPMGVIAHHAGWTHQRDEDHIVARVGVSIGSPGRVATALLPSHVLVGDAGVHAQGDHDYGETGAGPCCCQEVWSTRRIGLQVTEEICHQQLDIDTAPRPLERTSPTQVVEGTPGKTWGRPR